MCYYWVNSIHKIVPLENKMPKLVDFALLWAINHRRPDAPETSTKLTSELSFVPCIFQEPLVIMFINFFFDAI